MQSFIDTVGESDAGFIIEIIMTWETIIFYVLLAVTWYIRTTTAYLRYVTYTLEQIINTDSHFQHVHLFESSHFVDPS